MRNKTKASIIGGVLGFAFGGPVGAGIGVAIGQTVFNTDDLDDFRTEIKRLARLYADVNDGKLTSANWETLYRKQLAAHKKAEEKYGEKDTIFTKNFVKELVAEALEEG